MAIIRKKLSPEELLPSNVRTNPTTGEVEYSPDGGATWNDAPSLDPRHSDAFRLPPLTGEDAKCDAAARMVAGFQDALTHFEGSVNAAVYATGIFSILLKVPFLPGVLIGLAIVVFGELINIGAANIAAAFTSTVWDEIECVIYCNIGENGQMSVAQRDAIMAQIADDQPGVVYNTLVNLVNLFGEVLLSNAGVDRTETGDCAGCDCNENFCKIWDFAASDQTWSGGSTYVTGGFPNNQPREGTAYYRSFAQITLPLTALVEVDSIEVHFTGTQSMGRILTLRRTPGTETVNVADFSNTPGTSPFGGNVSIAASNGEGLVLNFSMDHQTANSFTVTSFKLCYHGLVEQDW